MGVGGTKAKAATFRSSSESTVSEDQRLRCALAIIGDYLSDAARSKLYRAYSISMEDEDKLASNAAFARQLAMVNDPHSAMKRARSDSDLYQEPAKKVKKTRL